MAKPRVFVSSTYYDLKNTRATLESFIESLGFEPVLSENGGIPYAHDVPLDESCYHEVGNADIFVLIVGSRYGSPASSESDKDRERSFYEEYESVTRKEHAQAAKQDIPIYVFVEAGVHAEYQTYKLNRDNEGIQYAHVGSVNIFKFLDSIFKQDQNNVFRSFDRPSDIENWLRDQWAGRFQEFLRQQSQHRQLSTLSDQVVALQAVNKTFEKYLQIILEKLAPDDATQIIHEQEKAFHASLEQLRVLHNNEATQTVAVLTGLSMGTIKDILEASNTYDQFIDTIRSLSGCHVSLHLPHVINLARAALNKPPFPVPDEFQPSQTTTTTPDPYCEETPPT